MITNNTFMTKVQPPMVRGVKKESVVGTHEIGDVPSPVARVRPTDAATKAKPKTIIIIRMTILGIVRSKKACQRSVKFTSVLSFFVKNGIHWPCCKRSMSYANNCGRAGCAADDYVLHKRDGAIIRFDVFLFE